MLHTSHKLNKQYITHNNHLDFNYKVISLLGMFAHCKTKNPFLVNFSMIFYWHLEVLRYMAQSVLIGDFSGYFSDLEDECSTLYAHSDSEYLTMAGKRSPPSPSSEYTFLSTLMLGDPGPANKAGSWGDMASNRACWKERRQSAPTFNHLILT